MDTGENDDVPELISDEEARLVIETAQDQLAENVFREWKKYAEEKGYSLDNIPDANALTNQFRSQLRALYWEMLDDAGFSPTLYNGIWEDMYVDDLIRPTPGMYDEEGPEGSEKDSEEEEIVCDFSYPSQGHYPHLES
jgi:hypothetical protein